METAIPFFVCTCGSEINATIYPSGNYIPEPGDLSFCAQCGTPWVFGEDFKQRTPTRLEVGEMLRMTKVHKTWSFLLQQVPTRHLAPSPMCLKRLQFFASLAKAYGVAMGAPFPGNAIRHIADVFAPFYERPGEINEWKN